MDSEEDDHQFANEGGQALELGDDFDSEEEVDDDDEFEQQPAQQQFKQAQTGPRKGQQEEIKGEAVEN